MGRVYLLTIGPIGLMGYVEYSKRDYQEMLTTTPGYVEDKVNNELMTDIQEDLSTQLSLLERIDLGKASLDMDYLFESFRYRLVSGEDCLKLAESIERVFPDHKE